MFCSRCGAPVSGRYCSQCGKRAQSSLREYRLALGRRNRGREHEAFALDGIAGMHISKTLDALADNLTFDGIDVSNFDERAQDVFRKAKRYDARYQDAYEDVMRVLRAYGLAERK